MKLSQNQLVSEFFYAPIWSFADVNMCSPRLWPIKAVCVL